jgi:hypothetical protein
MTAAEFLSDDASNILKLIYTYAYGVMLSGFNLRLLFHQKPISPSQHPCLVCEFQLVCISCIKCRTEMDPTLSLEALDSYRDGMYLYIMNINHNGWASSISNCPMISCPYPNPQSPARLVLRWWFRGLSSEALLARRQLCGLQLAQRLYAHPHAL